MVYRTAPSSMTLSDPYTRFQGHGVTIDALDVFCAQLKRDLFVIAKFLFYTHLHSTPPLGFRWNITKTFLYWKLQWSGYQKAKKSLRICLFVSTQYTNASNGQPPHDGIGRRAMHGVALQKNRHSGAQCCVQRREIERESKRWLICSRDQTASGGCGRHWIDWGWERASDVGGRYRCSNSWLTVMNASNLSVDTQTSGNFIHHHPQPTTVHLPVCLHCSLVSFCTSIPSLLSPSSPRRQQQQPHKNVTPCSQKSKPLDVW